MGLVTGARQTLLMRERARIAALQTEHVLYQHEQAIRVITFEGRQASPAGLTYQSVEMSDVPGLTVSEWEYPAPYCLDGAYGMAQIELARRPDLHALEQFQLIQRKVDPLEEAYAGSGVAVARLEALLARSEEAPVGLGEAHTISQALLTGSGQVYVGSIEAIARAQEAVVRAQEAVARAQERR
jgi:hypothetical protein